MKTITYGSWVVAALVALVWLLYVTGCGAAQDLLQKPGAKAGGDVDQETTQEAEQTEKSARGGDVETEKGDVKQKTEYYGSDPIMMTVGASVGAAVLLFLLMADRPPMGPKMKAVIMGASALLVIAPILALILTLI